MGSTARWEAGGRRGQHTGLSQQAPGAEPELCFWSPRGQHTRARVHTDTQTVALTGAHSPSPVPPGCRRPWPTEKELWLRTVVTGTARGEALMGAQPEGALGAGSRWESVGDQGKLVGLWMAEQGWPVPCLLEQSLLLAHSAHTCLHRPLPPATLLSGQETARRCRVRAQMERSGREDQRACTQTPPGALTGDQEALGSLFSWGQGTKPEICKAAHLRLEPHCAVWHPQGWQCCGLAPRPACTPSQGGALVLGGCPPGLGVGTPLSPSPKLRSERDIASPSAKKASAGFLLGRGPSHPTQST